MIGFKIILGFVIGAVITEIFFINKKKVFPVTLTNGDYIKITYLPPCRNGMGSPNPYIGMEGTVHDFDGEQFDIFTGTSWLVGIKIKTCKFIKK